MKSILEWNNKMKFTLSADSGHAITIDAGEDFGGENSATRPKELVLEGLVGCTAMDIIAILKKMRIEPTSFRMEAEADLTDEHPKVFSKVHLVYVVSDDVPEDKLKRAINLSQDMYCGVSAMFRNGGAEITWEYRYE